MFLERFHSCFPRGALVFLPVLHSWTGELRGTVPESEFSSHAKFGFSAAPCCCEPGAPFTSWYWGEGHLFGENVPIRTSSGQFSVRWNFSFLLQILRWSEPQRLASLAANKGRLLPPDIGGGTLFRGKCPDRDIAGTIFN